MRGVLVFQNVVQAPEIQSKKNYFNEASHLPGNPLITAHAAEVLHQVEGAKISSGGWVSGDAWFRSVLSAVEVKVCFNVFSTCFIKQNTEFFPIQALHSCTVSYEHNTVVDQQAIGLFFKHRSVV